MVCMTNIKMDKMMKDIITINKKMSREILGAEVTPGNGGDVRVMIGWFLTTMLT